MTPLATIISRRLRWKLLFIMLLLALGQRITFSIIHSRAQEEILRQSLASRMELQRNILVERGQTLARDLRRQAENDIAAFNFSGNTDTLKEAVHGHATLAYAILMDAARVPYVHTARPDLLQSVLSAPEDLFAARQPSSVRQEFGQGEHAVMEFIEPIRFGGQPWGVLRLGFSLAPLNRELAQMQGEHARAARALFLRSLRVSGLFVLLTVCLIIWVSRAMTMPIRQLTDAANKVARGDFNAVRDIVVSAEDEVGDLSKAFVAMTANLKSSYAELESQVAEKRRANMFLDSIVEHLPGMLFVKDARDLRYVLMNKAGEELIGIPQKDFIGKGDHQFYSPEIANFFIGKDREALASGRLLDIPEEPITTRAKGLRYLHTRKIPLLGPGGVPQYLLGISEDITVLKQVQDERRLFFLHSLELLCIADLAGRFLQVNPAFETTLGFSTQELLSRPFLEFVHPDDLEATQAAVADLAEGREVIRFENRYIGKDGSIHWLQWSARADPASGKIYAAARDMTERRELEKEIVQISTLEQERIARDLHDGLSQILTGLALKCQLIGHDLSDAGSSVLAERARVIMALANQASEQARALARGLDPVMLTEGLPVALLDLAQTTTELFGIPCQFDPDEFDAAVDKFESTHLYRIAQEAVNNAVRHGKPGCVRIALTTRESQLCLSVSDDGTGMPPESVKPYGSGLRNMGYRARLIGAALSIAANEAGGTTVACTLSLRPRDLPTAAPSKADVAP